LGYTFQIKGLKELKVNLLVNNLLNEKYESNAWVYSSYQQPDNSQPHRDRYEDYGYFPQAGTNVLANLVLKF
jgi:iron complex outermembrane receptor protein